MTFRRVMLVVLPLLAAGFLFMLLKHLYRGYLASLEPPGPDVSRAPPEEFKGEEQLIFDKAGWGGSRNLDLVQQDAQGRVTMRFVSPEVVHLRGNISHVTRPCIQFFTKAGEVLCLTGAQAEIYTKGRTVQGISDIRSGRVWGRVVLSHDRGTPDDPLDDLLVGVPELRFDNEKHELSTDEPVLLVGPDVDLTARRMLMTLDPQTRRVTTMTFYEDILITMEAGDRLRMALTGRAPEEPAPGPAPSAGERSGPGGKGVSEKGIRPFNDVEGLTPFSPEVPVEPRAEDRELWQVDLMNNVEARQMDQRLLCAHLRLYNETARSAARPDTEGGAEAAPSGASAAGPEGGTEAPPTRDAAAAGPDGPSESPPSREAAPDVPRYQQPGAAGPVVVVADGPMIITPVDAAERRALGEARHEVTATGNPVVLIDGDMRVEGAEVNYNVKAGTGRVEGKEGSILLEQPGRLHLTGGRLAFNRDRGIVNVFDEGMLKAQIATESLTGGAPAAKPGAPGTSALEATWKRGMDLEFYPSPRSQEGAMPELRRAEFHGHAIVKHRDGLMKGDDLEMDFSPAAVVARNVPMPEPAERARPGRITAWNVRKGDQVRKGQVLAAAESGRSAVEVVSPYDGTVAEIRHGPGAAVPAGEAIAVIMAKGGQAVERLQGRGGVFVQNQRAAAEPGGLSQVGDIASERLDIRFRRTADGGSEPEALKASGRVAINDPKGKIRAEDLTVRFKRNPKGELDADFLEATGSVLIEREDLHAKGDYVKRDMTGGVLLLQGKPAEARRTDTRIVDDRKTVSTRRIVGERIEFLEKQGTASVRGAGELEVPATTDLRGRPRTSATPLLVRWKRSMHFEDARDFAHFDGDVQASTGGGRLDAQKLWIYFKDRPVPPEAPGASAPAPAGGAPGPPAARSAGGDTLDRMLGGKAVDRILAEGKVRAVDQQLAPDGTLQFRMEMTGNNLTHVQEDRKTYMREPGDLWILARERPAPGEKPSPGVAPETADALWQGQVPPGYSRIQVRWTDSMAYEGKTDRAYFKGDVEAVHQGRGISGETGGAGRRPTTTRLRSGDLQVVFSERPAQAPAAGAAPEKSPQESLSVEKLVADKGVRFWVNDRCGSGERLIYQREPELVRIYSGPEQWASIWQEDEARQQYGTIVARAITYWPSTGRIEAVDQQEIQVAPKP